MYGYENDFEFKNEHQIKNLQELLLQQSISVFIMNETRENQIKKQIKTFFNLNKNILDLEVIDFWIIRLRDIFIEYNYKTIIETPNPLIDLIILYRELYNMPRCCNITSIISDWIQNYFRYIFLNNIQSFIQKSKELLADNNSQELNQELNQKINQIYYHIKNLSPDIEKHWLWFRALEDYIDFINKILEKQDNNDKQDKLEIFYKHI